MPYDIRSPYRPLTRTARQALEQYDIIDDLPPTDGRRNNGVVVKQRPPEELLVTHELEIDHDPVVIATTDHDDIVRIYHDPGSVTVNGIENNISPEEAVKHAQQRDNWTITTGSPDAILE